MTTPRKSIAVSTSKVKEKPLDETLTKEKQKTLSSSRTYFTPKASASEIYSHAKIKDKIGPGSVTDINTPKITARDISKSSKDSSKAVNHKIPSKTNILKSSKSEFATVKKESKKTLIRDNSSSEITPKTSKINTNIKKATSLKDIKGDVKTDNKISKDKTDHKISSKTNSILKKSNNATATIKKSGTPRLAKDLPFVGLLVNSPPSQRKVRESLIPDTNKETQDLVKDRQNEKATRDSTKERRNENTENKGDIVKDSDDRQRSKTRTLNDNEIKVLNEGIDNNSEMNKLSKKLNAKPKAFFIDLDDKPKANSEEDYSYEDDFESYESDFESYQSENTDSSCENSDVSTKSDRVYQAVESEEVDVKLTEEINHKIIELEETHQKLDEERMLDSGSFDLRDVQRSANKLKTMENIQESAESNLDDSKKLHSLNDEGFQEMSSSSAVSNLERPTFIDFSKSKENKQRRLVRERQKKRAEDLLSMISLHEVSYILFDMKPVPYDQFMLLYGNNNASQIATQTYDDGVEVEIQTDEIYSENKWTQHPVAFSDDNVTVTDEISTKKDDLSFKFRFLWSNETDSREISDEFRKNPLRVYLEQKNGVGSDEIMSHANYERITKKASFINDKLLKFLAKTEKKVFRALSNTKSQEEVKKTDWPFSEGYVHLFDNIENDARLFYLHKKTVSHVIFSETVQNLILTVHEKIQLSSDELNNLDYDEVSLKKCAICLWDLSVASHQTFRMPAKMLVAVENAAICRFRGDVDGLVAGALDDGSIHLWDLSESASWHAEVLRKPSTEPEVDRNRVAIRSCAYTSSALSLSESVSSEAASRVVGLQFIHRAGNDASNDEKILGQLCSLHEHGLLNLWTIFQEKHNLDISKDIGKAYWSKIRLKRTQTINLTETLKLPIWGQNTEFNLPAAKRKLSAKNREKYGNKKKPKERPLSSSSLDYDALDDWSRVAGEKEKKLQEPSASWECGLVCTDLKVLCCQRTQRFLVARNCGEVICCDRRNGVAKLKTFKIASDGTTITSLQVSQSRALLLAGGGGRLHLFSLMEARTLLTLDCEAACLASDDDGSTKRTFSMMSLSGVIWPPRDPCSVFALSACGRLCAWDLARSDVALTWRSNAQFRAADLAQSRDKDLLAVVTKSGAEEEEVEIHRLASNSRAGVDREQLFDSYVSLL